MEQGGSEDGGTEARGRSGWGYRVKRQRQATSPNKHPSRAHAYATAGMQRAVLPVPLTGCVSGFASHWYVGRPRPLRTGTMTKGRAAPTTPTTAEIIIAGSLLKAPLNQEAMVSAKRLRARDARGSDGSDTFRPPGAFFGEIVSCSPLGHAIVTQRQHTKAAPCSTHQISSLFFVDLVAHAFPTPKTCMRAVALAEAPRPPPQHALPLPLLPPLRLLLQSLLLQLK